MTSIRGRLAALILSGVVTTTAAMGDDLMIEDFTDAPTGRWAFFTDQVMGGVSTGQAALEDDGSTRFLRLRGDVSTENNGGFIQARMKLLERVPDNARGVELEVRGNRETYYIHLRTRATVLPWQFYQAAFETGDDWRVVRIPFTAFEARGRVLRGRVAPGAIRSLAVAAYGRNHVADVSVRRIGFY